MGNLFPEQEAMVEVFQQHMNAEMAGDLDATMATMTDAPHLHNISVKMGGVGREGVRQFYANHLIGKFFPPDVEFINVSTTIGEDQLVEENVIKFTHTMPMDWMIPGIPPTGRPVEVAVVVIVKFKNGKVAHEHIYWDQASVLVQLGLLDPSGLPVSGGESAQKILDQKLPARDI